MRALCAHPDPAGVRILLDGVHLLRAALKAGIHLEIVAVAASRLDGPSEEGSSARALDHQGIQVISVADNIFSSLSPIRSATGLVAIAVRNPIDAAVTCTGDNPFILGVVGVQDPGNLGAVLRVGAAGGVTGVLVGTGSASPFSWKAIRGSMGAIFKMPVTSGIATEALLECLKKHDLRTIAAVPAGGRHPDSIDWTGPTALILGGEGQGLDKATISACDIRVTIPMTLAVESLNVATAAAILIYAARKQRV